MKILLGYSPPPGNISRELAHKIWRVTPSDISLGIPEPTVPTYPFIGGVDWGSGGSSSSKHPANDAATAFISEVERALYADSTGYPENGTPNYFKAAENYAIYGDNFLDFPKDTSTCFAGLGSTGRSTSNPPPGFERSARSSALYERRQTPSQAGSASTPNFSGVRNNKKVKSIKETQYFCIILILFELNNLYVLFSAENSDYFGGKIKIILNDCMF